MTTTASSGVGQCLDANLDYVKNAANTTHCAVVDNTWDGTYSGIAAATNGGGTVTTTGWAISDESTGRKLTVPQVVFSGAGISTTNAVGSVVLHNNSDEVTFSVTATGSAVITTGADVTVATFNIVNPQPTSA